MKKLVFAFQIICIIILFPLYVILELNHDVEKLPVKDSIVMVMRDSSISKKNEK